MISFDGEVQKMDMTVEGFGQGKMVEMEPGKDYRTTYTEGPWIQKRNGKYQLIYAGGGIPEHLAYSESDSPTGPWKYKGIIMEQTDSTNSFTNHPAVMDFKGKSYFFYHTGNLPGGGGFARSVAVEPFEYNADGSFPKIVPTRSGAPAIATFDPYRKVEAETMAWSKGVKTEPNAKTGVYVSDIHNGDFIKVANVNFKNGGAKKFGASVASALRGGKIEVRIDSPEGPLVAELDVPGTGGWEEWKYLETPVKMEEPGVHDIYFVFTGRKGPKLFNFDYWQFK